MEIIKENAEYAVVRKLPGEDSEKDIPAGFYCVHRLDKAAGGLLVYGKNSAAAGKLSRELTEHSLHKSYLIVIPGALSEKTGEFTDLLFKDSRKQKMFPVKRMRAGVKEARLSYRVLKESSDCSLVEVALFTGRFHQIRAQFASRQHPLIGDSKYGSRVKSPHIALFCHKLSFHDPGSGALVETELSMPEEFPWGMFQES